MKRTPLFEEHRKLGARMIEFGGWEMPVWYTSIVEEHKAVRTQAGLFDLSHMGRVKVSGPGTLDFLQLLVTCDLSKVPTGGCKYGFFCDESGGILDDLVVYRGGDYSLAVVNASNLDANLAWMRKWAGKFDVRIEDLSAAWAMIAVQGPNALGILQPLTKIDLFAMRYYSFAEGAVDRASALVSRTGYTGEDGFEVYLDAARSAKLWSTLLLTGKSKGIAPIGLGARDTLRLEAGMPLYGHEITRGTNPVEAGLGWAVSLEKGDFIGRSPIERAREAGAKRRLVGLEIEGRIPRQGYPVLKAGRAVGEITSGTQSPSSGRFIAMAYVEAAEAQPGARLDVSIRGASVPAAVVKLPFYKRPKERQAT